MNPQKSLKVSGIIILILGIIHSCATLTVILPFKALPKDDMLTAIYMFLCTGLAVLLIGWIQMYIARQKLTDVILLKIMKATIIFLFILGAGAVSLMPVNPFAYITLFIAIFEWICLRMLSKTISTLN